MRPTIFTAVAAALLAILHASFFRALPPPFSAISLPLILVVSLIAAFRFREAYAAAAAAGVIMDALSSLPPGTMTLTLVALTAATTFLFTRIFTNHTWSGALGINAAAFVMLRLALRVIDAVRATIEGVTYRFVPDGAEAVAFLSALAAQIVVALAAITLAAYVSAAFSRSFIRRTRF